MTELDEYGYPIFDEDGDIYPLTLLIDDTMRDGVLCLSVPTSDDGEDTEKITIKTPKFEYA